MKLLPSRTNWKCKPRYLYLLLNVLFFAQLVAGCQTKTVRKKAESESSTTSRRYALIVGVGSVRIQRQPIPSANTDARLMSQTLQQYADFPAQNIRVLTSDADQKPTRSNILTGIDEIAKAARPNDLVYVHIIAHGMQRGAATFLIPWDVDIRKEAFDKSIISMGDLAKHLSKVKSQRKIVLIEACRYDMNAPPLTSCQIQQLETQSAKVYAPLLASTLLVFSSQMNEWSFYSPEGRGYMSEALTAGLHGAAADKSGSVTVKNLLLYTKKAVYGEVREERGYYQIPNWSTKNNAILDTVLARNHKSGSGGTTAVPLGAPTDVNGQYRVAKQKGYELQLAGQHLQSRKHFLKALQLRPTSATTAGEVGYVSENLHDLTMAKQYYQRAVQLSPKWLWALQRLADTCFKKGEYKETATYLRRALVFYPKDMEALGRLASLMLFKNHKYGEAEHLYRRMLAIEPDNPSLYVSIADSLLRQNKRSQAIVAAKRALALGYNKPDPVFRKFNLGK